MAVFEQNRIAPFGAISVYKAVSFMDRIVRTVRAKLIAERTHNELSRLSPSQLRDIGLGDHDLGAFSRDLSHRGL